MLIDKTQQKELSEDIGAIKAPGIRISFRMFIIAIVTLSSVIVFLWKITENDKKEQMQSYKDQAAAAKEDCKERKTADSIVIILIQAANYRLQEQKDSMLNDALKSSEMRVKEKNETIEQERKLLNGQKITLSSK